MLKSYFKVAFRTFSRNRLITFINVFGLGLAMSVGMMIMIRFQFESGFDSFHPNSERIYRITSEYHKKSGETWRMASTSLPLQKEISESRLRPHLWEIKTLFAQEEWFAEKFLLYVPY